MNDLKVAVVHDWLLGMRGGEKVLEAICELFPQAEIFTLLYDKDRIGGKLARMPIKPSWLQRLPLVRSYYRYLLPLMPQAVETFDLSGYDLVISSSHCVAKGAKTSSKSSDKRPLHVCYCHTPMRYLHYQFENYFNQGSLSWLRPGARLLRPWLMRWDVQSSRSVDYFIANSGNVRDRIQKSYDRDAEVIYPPVDTDFFTPSDKPPREEGYYLVAGALVPYKRVDVAIDACSILGARLKIVGIGNDEKSLRRLAQGTQTEFLGWRSNEELRDLYQGCRALLFPQDEDFGISAVEAMACGKPVIAFGRGGALETVIDGATGVLFPAQTADSMAEALRRAESITFDRMAIRAHAERFDRKVFLGRFAAAVQNARSQRPATALSC